MNEILKATQERRSIRTATTADLDAITGVEAQCFPPAEVATRETFADRLKYFPSHFWLMLDGDKVISFIDGMTTDAPNLTDEMYSHAEMHNEAGKWQMIFGVCTLPEYRRKGFAGELMRRVIRDSREHGREGLVLTCKAEMSKWHERFGFVCEGVSSSVHGGAVWYQMRINF